MGQKRPYLMRNLLNLGHKCPHGAQQMNLGAFAQRWPRRCNDHASERFYSLSARPATCHPEAALFENLGGTLPALFAAEAEPRSATLMMKLSNLKTPGFSSGEKAITPAPPPSCGLRILDPNPQAK